jgi:Tol biopolymer transport system component
MLIQDGRWSPPQPPAFATEASDDVPFFSPDGRKLYFLSNRSPGVGRETTKERIWYVERDGGSWAAPKMLESPANAMDLHWQFSVSENGTLYFASSEAQGRGLNDIYRSVLEDGVYQQPENLGVSINSEHADFAPYVSPDESFLIFTSVGRPGGFGGSDLYISFRTQEGGWTRAENMGEVVNSAGGELLTSLSPDGRFLFFTGLRDGRKGVFWMDAGIIEELRLRQRDRHHRGSASFGGGERCP